ncbi:MAG: hypothetical protein H8D96_09270 [Desulfobacterales bacterium]|uniref:GxxExxY protein n=1 Tax=Candidatus Desulfatibia vada TaxID=2841696 RepID=A0A8J6TQC6_9BACT|nr:hypothetical protein [Candidatus Desulfatibia vada]MBL6972024.1 hypothetical protein [Desulfobacterales bacterium]
MTNYLKATGIEVGLLINFAEASKSNSEYLLPALAGLQRRCDSKARSSPAIRYTIREIRLPR